MVRFSPLCRRIWVSQSRADGCGIWQDGEGEDSLPRGVGVEVNVVDNEEVVGMVRGAVGKWAFTRNLSALARQRLLVVEEAE
jgi:hypothetical protein